MDWEIGSCDGLPRTRAVSPIWRGPAGTWRNRRFSESRFSIRSSEDGRALQMTQRVESFCTASEAR